MVEKNGIRIAILNYTYGTNGIAEPEDYLVDDLTEEKAMRELDWAEENADFSLESPEVFKVCFPSLIKVNEISG